MTASYPDRFPVDPMSETTGSGGASGKPSRRVLLALCLVPILVHLVALASSRYGYFIDEFYYIACSKRLAFGYVDHPPLAPGLLAMTRLVFGESILAIRFLPILASGATVWVTGRLVGRLGGGRYATVLAGLCVGLSPVLLAMTGFFSMNAFEPLLWTLLVLTLVRLVQTGQSRLWLVAGLLVGLAFENKHTILAFVAALGVGILATDTRKVLRDPWLWAGAAVAVLLTIPNLAWQILNGWPSLEFYRNAQMLKNQPTPPLVSLLWQVLSNNPLVLPVWLAGLLYVSLARQARAVRFFGVMFVVLLTMHVYSRSGRSDRTAAAYPLLLAAGAVAIERWLRWPRWQAARIVLPTLVAAGGLALTPLVVPILPPPELARYVAALGINQSAERGKTSPLPQLLADRTGWESFVDEVARVYDDLPAEDRQRALVYVPSYGHAGALELLGSARGLPPVIASQNTYWHWSVGRTDTDVLIAVGLDEEIWRQLFRDVRVAGRVRCDYCMSWRSDMPIYVARGPIVPLGSAWPEFRHYE